MAKRTLHLQKSELQNVNYQWVGAYRLRVDVTDPFNTGMDINVFLYERGLVNPYTELTEDYFLTIASPADLADYPVSEPNGRTPYPFFRLPYIEIDVRSAELGARAWRLIVREVGNLCKAMDRLELLVPTEGVYVGDPPPTHESGSSESGSGSDSGSDSR